MGNIAVMLTEFLAPLTFYNAINAVVMWWSWAEPGPSDSAVNSNEIIIQVKLPFEIFWSICHVHINIASNERRKKMQIRSALATWRWLALRQWQLLICSLICFVLFLFLYLFIFFRRFFRSFVHFFSFLFHFRIEFNFQLNQLLLRRNSYQLHGLESLLLLNILK